MPTRGSPVLWRTPKCTAGVSVICLGQDIVRAVRQRPWVWVWSMPIFVFQADACRYLGFMWSLHNWVWSCWQYWRGHWRFWGTWEALIILPWGLMIIGGAEILMSTYATRIWWHLIALWMLHPVWCHAKVRSGEFSYVTPEAINGQNQISIVRACFWLVSVQVDRSPISSSVSRVLSTEGVLDSSLMDGCVCADHAGKV